MTPLGRGLASLIPRRNRKAAEDLIEQIDSMEEVPGENPPTGGEQEQRAEADETVQVTATKSVRIEEEHDEGFQHDEQIARPKKPLVTPISIDPDDTGDDVVGEAEEPPEEPAKKVTMLEIDLEVEAEEDTDERAEAQEDEEDQVEASADEEEEPEAEVTAEVEEKVVVQEETEEAGDEEEEAPKAARSTKKVTKTTKRGVHARSVNSKRKALVKETAQAMAAEEQAATADEVDFRLLGNTVESVPVGSVEVNPLQPRRVFDKEDLEDLVSSLDQHGMLQPIVVVERPEGGYELVAGERRLRAAKLLGWKEVPCVVRRGVGGDKNRLELALIENVQRQNLNPVEEAMGYKRLHEEYGMTHEEIGQRVGKSRVGITNMLRVLQLPAEIQRGLIENKITVGHARAILMIPDEEKQLRFYRHVLDEGLTVRKAENRARNIQRAMNLNDPLRKKNRGRPQLALKYDGKLQEKFGFNARVKFDATKNRFEVVFHAHSEQEAIDLVERLLGEQALPEDVDADVMEE